MNREILEKEFDQSQIKQRKGAGSRTFPYVDTPAVIRRLNEAFEGEWNFKVVNHIESESEVVVLGELSTAEISKQQFGSKLILKNSTLGDNLKAAASDALKKCATLLGVGLHLYADTISNANCDEGRGNRLTQEQSKEIYDFCEKLGWKSKELQEKISERFAGKSLHTLTQEEATKVIAGLQKRLAEKPSDGVGGDENEQ